MPIWSNSTISRFAQDAESYIAVDAPCILDRFSLEIEYGIGTYTLPSYAIGIDRVTWNGKKIYPFTGLEIPYFDFSNLITDEGAFQDDSFQQDAFQTGSEGASEQPTGEPSIYFYSGLGLNTIKFRPIPNISILASSGNLYDSSIIATSVIVQFYRTPDFSTFRVPDWYRRAMIKEFVLWKCFSQEGMGQDLQGAEYFKNKFFKRLNRFKLILNQMFVSRDWSVQGQTPYRWQRRGPVFPSNFGVVTE